MPWADPVLHYSRLAADILGKVLIEVARLGEVKAFVSRREEALIWAEGTSLPATVWLRLFATERHD